MVEGAALEMLFRGNFNEGSNPSLSVIRLDQKVEVAFCVTSTFILGYFLGAIAIVNLQEHK